MAWLTSYSFKWYRDSWTDTLSKKECPECLFSIYPFSSHSHFQHFLKKDSFQSNTHSLWCYHNNINSFGNFKGRKKNVLSQDRIMEAEEGRKKLVLFFHYSWLGSGFSQTGHCHYLCLIRTTCENFVSKRKNESSCS